jgi:hypothetical protein
MRTICRIALALALGTALAAPARAVQVSTGSGSGLAGQTVDITLTSTATTGLGILSLQFDLTYNANLVTATDVLESGTLVGTAGWGEATFGVTTTGSSGRIRVSHAGTAALAGAGPLLRIRFLVDPAQFGATATSLTLSNLVFNEGVPHDTTSNGTLTINATPVIAVSPNSGEVVRGSTLAFTVSGSVTNPVTWSVSDPLLATISPAGVLTGVAPGAVRVIATDAAARTDMSDGEVLIRGMGLAAGTASVLPGQSLTVPLTVTSLNGLGIRAGQVRLAFNGALFTATGASAPPGTLLSGHATPGFGAGVGTCTVDFASVGDVTGSGVLCHVTFLAASATTGSTGLTVTQALFNETLPAKVTNGSLTVSPLPSITVSPDAVTLLAGQQRQFTVGGSPTPPVTWSVLDPSVASIAADGLLTALAGGTTRVRAEDAVGAVDLNTSVTVYDFRAAPDTVTAPPGSTVVLALASDRALGGLGIVSLQHRLTWSSPHVTGARARTQGLIATWAPNLLPVVAGNRVDVTAAGAEPLSSVTNDIQWFEFDIAAGAPNVDIPVTLASLLCNEGTPRAQLGNGLIRVRDHVDVPPSPAARALALAAPWPNPAPGGAALRFAIPEGGAPARLVIHGLDGRRVRTLVDAVLPAGEHAAVWDGRDARGGSVAPGLYVARLEWRGLALARKVAVVR